MLLSFSVGWSSNWGTSRYSYNSGNWGSGGASTGEDALLLESGDYFLLESGDNLLLE